MCPHWLSSSACSLSPTLQDGVSRNPNTLELLPDKDAVVMHGRHEEARTVLKRLHDDNEDHTFWEKEYIVLVAQLDMERRETEGVRWWHMFTNRRELHRAMLSVVALTSTQTNGAQTIQVFQVRGWPHRSSTDL